MEAGQFASETLSEQTGLQPAVGGQQTAAA